MGEKGGGERKRDGGLREKQKATIGEGELREEMAGSLVTVLVTVLVPSQKHKE